MAIEHRMVHFRTGDLSEVVAEIESISARQVDNEWVTISPWVDPEHLPVVSVLRRLFSGRGSKVPEVTWVPAQGREPAQFGVLHSTGPQALERLGERGVVLPSTWKMVSDHSRRGLLMGVHPDTTGEQVVRAAIDAAAALAAVPTDDRWVAQISVGA